MSFSKKWLEIRGSKSYYWFVLYLPSSIGIFQSIKGFLCIWICWTDACCKTYGWICVKGTYTWQNEPWNVELHPSLFNLPIINVLLFPPRESCSHAVASQWRIHCIPWLINKEKNLRKVYLQETCQFAITIRNMSTIFPLFLISKDAYNISKSQQAFVDINAWMKDGNPNIKYVHSSPC